MSGAPRLPRPPGHSIDADGDLDAIFGNADPDEIWRNNADGTFTLLSTGLPTSFGEGAKTRAIAIGDLDNDGNNQPIIKDDRSEDAPPATSHPL